MSRLQADARLTVSLKRLDENVIQCFRWHVNRFRLALARRFLREVAFNASVRVDIDEECGFWWSTLYVTFRGSTAAIDRAMALVTDNAP